MCAANRLIYFNALLWLFNEQSMDTIFFSFRKNCRNIFVVTVGVFGIICVEIYFFVIFSRTEVKKKEKLKRKAEIKFDRF